MFIWSLLSQTCVLSMNSEVRPKSEPALELQAGPRQVLFQRSQHRKQFRRRADTKKKFACCFIFCISFLRSFYLFPSSSFSVFKYVYFPVVRLSSVLSVHLSFFLILDPPQVSFCIRFITHCCI